MSTGLLALAGVAACSRSPAPADIERASLVANPAPPRPEFVEVAYPELYRQIFTQRRVLSPADRAALWLSYQGKWVRWTGTLTSITSSGATFKLRPQTVTFDVSVELDEGGRARVHQYRAGDTVSFIGRITSAVEEIRTVYLVHGDVVSRPLDGLPARR